MSASFVGQGSRWVKGVIWGVPIGLTMEEVKTNLKGGNLKRARRLQVTRDGARKDSEYILLDFEEEVLPRKVTVGYLSYNVCEYVPRPVRCYNCQRFGHTAKVCKGRRRCAKCGEDHEYADCVQKQAKCCNCGGDHSVAYGGCEVMKKQKEIQQVRVQKKVTYADAVKVVNHRSGRDVEERNQVERGVTVTGNEERMMLDLKKLVTFITGVINATMEIKSKTERIQIIVKAAAHHLGLSDLSWEEVRNDLSSQASHEQLSVG